MILIKVPTVRPTIMAPNIPILVNSCPRKVMVSGINQFTKKYEATAVKTIDPQLPIFNAFCTASVLSPAFSEMRTKKVPIIEKRIPIDAINIGKRIGDIPPN